MKELLEEYKLFDSLEKPKNLDMRMLQKALGYFIHRESNNPDFKRPQWYTELIDQIIMDGNFSSLPKNKGGRKTDTKKNSCIGGAKAIAEDYNLKGDDKLNFVNEILKQNNQRSISKDTLRAAKSNHAYAYVLYQSMKK